MASIKSLLDNLKKLPDYGAQLVASAKAKAEADRVEQLAKQKVASKTTSSLVTPIKQVISKTVIPEVVKQVTTKPTQTPTGYTSQPVTQQSVVQPIQPIPPITTTQQKIVKGLSQTAENVFQGMIVQPIKKAQEIVEMPLSQGIPELAKTVVKIPQGINNLFLRIGYSAKQAPKDIKTALSGGGVEPITQKVNIGRIGRFFTGSEWLSSYQGDYLTAVGQGEDPIVAGATYASQAIVDGVIATGIANKTMKELAKLSPNDAKVKAWTQLGMGDMNEIKQTWNNLQRKYQNNPEIITEINNSYNYLRRNGLPNTNNIRTFLGKVGEIGSTDIKNLGTIQDIITRNVYTSGKPNLMVKGELPGYGIVGQPQPTIGGSIQPVVPVGGEIIKTDKGTQDQSLLQEAKKYKSAEEFVNNQKILYHGTNQDFDKFVKSDLGKSTGAVSAKEGFFFTDNMSEAQNYANVADSKMVANFKKFQKQSEKYAKMVELAENQAQRTGDWDKVTKLQEEWNKFELDATRDAVVKNAKVYETVLDMKNPLTIEINGRPEPGQLTDTIKQAKKQGYDSVIFKNISDNPGVSIRPGGEQFTSNHYVVFSPSQIKTKSQLTDIWNKAQEEVKTQEPTTLQPSQQFIQDRETVVKQNELKEFQPERPLSFIQQIKQNLAPIRYESPQAQQAWKDYTSSKAIANEKANEEFMKLSDIPEQNSFQVIQDYQAGVQTEYTPKIKETFDALYNESVERGLDVGYLKDYIPQVYSNTPNEVIQAVTKFMESKGVDIQIISDYIQGKILPEEISKGLKMTPTFVKERAFPDYKTAMEFGLTPKFSHPAQLASYYRNQLETTLSNRKLISDLRESGDLVNDKLTRDYKIVEIPYTNEILWAKPSMARLLNGYFRDETNLGLGEKIIKGLATGSKRLQNFVLGAGIPESDINFFTVGQVDKSLTALEPQAVANLIRANSDTYAQKYFQANQPYITKMASQGINLSNRTGNWNKAYKELSSLKGFTGLMDKAGKAFDSWFGRKTFESFMPMQSINIFKQTYNSSLAKGMTDLEAIEVAGKATKNWMGMVEDLGRSQATRDLINTIFFAPQYREGLINIFSKTVESVYPKNWKDPSFAKNRIFLAGVALTYAIYNLVNKKLNGKYMWENEPGKEFDLKIPLPNGDYTYIAFHPSTLAFPRNMISGGIALGKGNLKLAGQKFGSIFSMGLKATAEIITNKDYFGNDIYKDDDSRIDKAKKIAEYLGLNYTHPYIGETLKLINKKTTWYKALSKMAELPLKFSTKDNIITNQYYTALDQQNQIRSKDKKRITKIYNQVKSLDAQNKPNEAEALYQSLDQYEKDVYQSIKTSEKLKETNSLKIKMYDLYLQFQELDKQGKSSYADEIYQGLTDREKEVYQLIKKTFNTNNETQ